MGNPAEPDSPPPVRRREIFAWVLYDWANSAYSTLLITIVLHYVQEVVLPGRWGPVVYAWGIAAAMFVAAVLSPIVGAVADANRDKRRWLARLALGGSLAAIVMAAAPPGQVWLVVAAFVLMNAMFELSLVPYNGFLPEISDEQTINRISAWGFAAGYLGGAIPLLLAGLIVLFGERLGLSEANQHRFGILLLGLWWGGFTLPAVLILRDRGPPVERTQSPLRTARTALARVGHTLAGVRSFPVLAWFLLAYLLYNDGVQTVITQANTLASKDLKFSVMELFYFVLLLQLIALPGSLLMGWLADRFGQKPVLLGCLVVWIGLLVGAMLVETKLQFWLMGIVLASVLGGTQAVGRALMGLLAPPRRTAEFFGFFNLSGKAASFLGPALFGLIFHLTASARLAALGLLPLFVLGGAIVARLSFRAGREQALREDVS